MLLMPLSPSARPSPAVDALDHAVGTVLHQLISEIWGPLGFSLDALVPRRHDTLCLVESCSEHAPLSNTFPTLRSSFIPVHRPQTLIYALHAKSDRHWPRELRHSDCFLISDEPYSQQGNVGVCSRCIIPPTTESRYVSCPRNSCHGISTDT